MMYYKRLRDLREDADLTQQQVADILGTSQIQYSRWETGQREILAHKIIILADHYKTTTDYILGRTNKR